MKNQVNCINFSLQILMIYVMRMFLGFVFGCFLFSCSNNRTEYQMYHASALGLKGDIESVEIIETKLNESTSMMYYFNNDNTISQSIISSRYFKQILDFKYDEHNTFTGLTGSVYNGYDNEYDQTFSDKLVSSTDTSKIFLREVNQSDNIRTDSLSLFIKKANDLTIYTYLYISPKREINHTTYKIDKRGNEVESEFIHNEKIHFRSKSRFDKQNLEVEKQLIIENGDSVNVIATFGYEVDKNGNWIVQNEFRDDEFYASKIRKIKYRK